MEWYRTYLSGRSQTVIVGFVSHGPLPINCGLPQGSVVGPNGFIAYTEEIVETISDFSVSSHQYADDTEISIAVFESDDSDKVGLLRKMFTHGYRRTVFN